MDTIKIRGARTHNLKNIDLDLPRNQLIVITGLSGSGKSSLAFDTLYAEGQRRYVESLSTYARQFLSIMEKPDVDSIEGLSPAISIEQKATSHNPRSTVGTITEIHDYLRLLFARVGQPHCPEHHTRLEAQTISQMVDQVLAQEPGQRLMLLAPVIRGRKGEHLQMLETLRSQGFIRARINGTVVELDPLPQLSAHKKHNIEAVIDRFKVSPELTLRLSESFETALRLGDGVAWVMPLPDANPTERSATEPTPQIFSSRFACPLCNYSLTELEPRLFSFNNPAGACPQCDGLGTQRFFDATKVVTHPELSLAAGAIRGWDRRTAYYFQMIEILSRHYQFDLDTPFHHLPEAIQQLILNGDSQILRFEFQGATGNIVKNQAFEGILPIMERRYRDSESPTVREELAQYCSTRPCPSCQGARLNAAARNVLIAERNLTHISAASIAEAKAFFTRLTLPGQRGAIADKIIKEIVERLSFLVNVGLNYLTLDRRAETLSGGEAQRIRLASQIGAGLVGVLYILDEPSIGLHQRDNDRLLNTLTHLRDLGNTVIVVEHDEDTIRRADFVVDIGPGAGVNGGYVVAQGTPQDISQHPQSLTGHYLSGQCQIALPAGRKTPNPERQLRIKNATGHNLKQVTVDIPLGLMTCITGVSGSGKSTLINDTLYPLTAKMLNHANPETCAPCEAIEGLEFLDKVVAVDQSPIGRTPRSNPATYTGLLTPIRELFAATPEARSRGYSPGRFSFNVKGGRCEACQGDGVTQVAMHFLADIYVVCDVCKGQRYNRETLDIRYKGKTISEVLAMTVTTALAFFAAIPTIARRLQALNEVGLSYVQLGQSATTLSGGEAQRVKLARELAKRDTGKTLYILDEPTTGLHFQDIAQLLAVLHHLRDDHNTIIIIEHNLDVIKTADWVIDLGPEGGDGGGTLVATGTPEQIAQHPTSHTGKFLAKMLG